LQAAFVVETHEAEGQWLEVQASMKLRMFRVETRRSTMSRTEWQHLMPLKICIKNKAVNDDNAAADGDDDNTNNNNNNNNNNLRLHLRILSASQYQYQ
jgi:hypothetical protein